jgi:hypothetical protein
MAAFTAVLLFGCSGHGSDSSGTSALGATAAATTTAAVTTTAAASATARCGPVAGVNGVSPQAVVACPAKEQCCNGFCVGDTELCVAPPPPPTCGVDATGTTLGCANGLICCDGKCAPGCTDPPPPPACNPASASPEAQCPPDEDCCNGKCQPDGEACAAPQCVTATDCTGALPQLCEICGNGQSECAHFECVAGTCEVVVCDPLPPTSNQ